MNTKAFNLPIRDDFEVGAKLDNFVAPVVER